MATHSIRYQAGFKYQLVEDYVIIVPKELWPAAAVQTEFLTLTPDGILVIKEGYAWDGPSGPAIDTRNFMRGSLVHDALYQLMREGFVSRELQGVADRFLQMICKADGMSTVRAWWVYEGLWIGGRPSTDPANEKEILEAP